jgi:hypothetical protein
MRIDTNLMQLATAIYEEAVAEVGEGAEAEALATAALVDLLGRSRVMRAEVTPTRPVYRRRSPKLTVLSAAG